MTSRINIYQITNSTMEVEVINNIKDFKRLTKSKVKVTG